MNNNQENLYYNRYQVLKNLKIQEISDKIRKEIANCVTDDEYDYVVNEMYDRVQEEIDEAVERYCSNLHDNEKLSWKQKFEMDFKLKK
jgi:hypothetical protein